MPLMAKKELVPTPSTVQIDPREWKRGGDPALLNALAAPSMYRGHPHVAVHETHASWVFVAGDRAYKVKKPVALGFLDYATLERRRSACQEEVRVNRELAPDLYLGVLAIVRSRGGFRLAADGAPDAIEYAVEMRSFGEEDTLAGLITKGSLTRRHVAAVASALASFHRSAEVVEDWRPDRVLNGWGRNVAELRRIDHPAAWRLDIAAGFAEAFVKAHALELGRRALLGLVRDGHGDLRCEHVLARPTVRIVDRIEFDPQLRRNDVACDLAFLTMDLEASGQRWAARELIGAYRHAGMSPGDEALRSFYAAHWAFVRAKVALIAVAEHDGDGSGEHDGDPLSEHLRRAQQLWSLGEGLCWRARAPLALVICGPAASGKSVLAGELSRRSEMLVVASDVVRKRLADLSPHESARAEHYSARFTHATYERLGRDALLALSRSAGVIVDATCQSREERELLLGRVRRVGRTCLVVRCEVPLEVALERAERRLADARRVSDATPQITERQFRGFEELDEPSDGSLLRLDATQAMDAQVAAVARAVDGFGLCGGAADAAPSRPPQAERDT
jgi:aminoglycoside phosphotransferase family enzyme/predicted kinase